VTWWFSHRCRNRWDAGADSEAKWVVAWSAMTVWALFAAMAVNLNRVMP
jgi:hypothetical protein